MKNEAQYAIDYRALNEDEKRFFANQYVEEKAVEGEKE